MCLWLRGIEVLMCWRKMLASGELCWRCEEVRRVREAMVFILAGCGADAVY